MERDLINTLFLNCLKLIKKLPENINNFNVVLQLKNERANEN